MDYSADAQGDARSRSARQVARHGFKSSGNWEAVFGTGLGHRRSLHGVALRPLHRQGRRGRKGGVRPADVRQRRAHSSRLRARPIQQRRSPAPLDRYLESRRPAARLPGARHLLRVQEMVRASTTVPETRCSSPRRPVTRRARPTSSTRWGNTRRSASRRSASMAWNTGGRRVGAQLRHPRAARAAHSGESAEVARRRSPAGRPDAVAEIRLGDYTLNVSPGGPRGSSPASPFRQTPRDRGAARHLHRDAHRTSSTWRAAVLTSRSRPTLPGPPSWDWRPWRKAGSSTADGRVGRTLAGDDTGQGNSISLRGDSGDLLRVTVYRYR